MPSDFIFSRKRLKKCKACKGKGEVTIPYSGILEHYPAKTIGSVCIKRTCPNCNGTGMALQEK